MDFIVKSNFERTIEIPDEELKGKDNWEIQEIVMEELENTFVMNNELDKNEFWESLEIEGLKLD